jgi:hypothetical protein
MSVFPLARVKDSFGQALCHARRKEKWPSLHHHWWLLFPRLASPFYVHRLEAGACIFLDSDPFLSLQFSTAGF